ncbi:MAG: hypothetical protein JO347_10985, partial [Candidatus Eremiobacteraeota bacterium]|nr:hypothetical protein [Candidatus Eremiobacteraeota bacterium]
LLEAAMRINELAIPRFFVDEDDGLYLSVDRELDQLDSAGLRALVCGLYGVAKDQYPQLVRIVTHAETLDSLEAAYKRSS